MSLELLFDPLFRVPFLTGLGLAVVLPLVGCYIRLREAWLAALGLAQVAAAGAVLGSLVGLPAIAGALTLSGITAVVAGRLARGGNDNHALMLLLGWSATLLAAANTTRGEDLGHAFVDGQLYFSGQPHLRAVLLLGLAVAVLLPWLSSRLLVARLFPEHETANAVAGWRYHVAFDLLVAATLALSATAIGVMATFAYVFVPPWVAFRRSSGWRRALLGALSLSVAAYVAGFAGAILLNQPFGPSAVAALLALGVGVQIARRFWARSGAASPCGPAVEGAQPGGEDAAE